MSTTAAKMTGVTYVNVNGRRVRSKKGSTLTVGGKVGKEVMSTSGFEGVATDEMEPGRVKVTVAHSDKDDVTSVQSWRGIDITFETDSGQTYLIADAGTVGKVELKDGELSFEMAGHPAELL